MHWPVAPADAALSHAEVHVWCVALVQPATLERELVDLLAEDERDRAARFHFEHLRRRFRVSHGVLRRILAHYTGIAAAQLRFAADPFGKPALTEPEGELRFNLSHSENLALIAVARGREVGVDIEFMRHVPEAEAVAKCNFSAREYAAYRALDEKEKRVAFFNCWTRKEAYLKARGEGLSFPLAQVDVAFAPAEVPGLLCVHGDTIEAARWSLRALHPANGYAAALAVAGQEVKLSCWQWR